MRFRFAEYIYSTSCITSCKLTVKPLLRKANVIQYVLARSRGQVYADASHSGTALFRYHSLSRLVLCDLVVEDGRFNDLLDFVSLRFEANVFSTTH